MLSFDAVVLANGAWLNRLARRFDARAIVQAGRGYSFGVPIEQMPAGPVYFPVQRVACTPLGDRLRVAGMVEYRAPEEPLDSRRGDAIVAAVRPLLRGVSPRRQFCKDRAQCHKCAPTYSANSS